MLFGLSYSKSPRDILMSLECLQNSVMHWSINVPLSQKLLYIFKNSASDLSQ